MCAFVRFSQKFFTGCGGQPPKTDTLRKTANFFAKNAGKNSGDFCFRNMEQEEFLGQKSCEFSAGFLWKKPRGPEIRVENDDFSTLSTAFSTEGAILVL